MVNTWPKIQLGFEENHYYDTLDSCVMFSPYTAHKVRLTSTLTLDKINDSHDFTDFIEFLLRNFTWQLNFIVNSQSHKLQIRMSSLKFYINGFQILIILFLLHKNCYYSEFLQTMCMLPILSPGHTLAITVFSVAYCTQICPSRPALGPSQPPVKWVLGLSQGWSAAGACCWPLTPF